MLTAARPPNPQDSAAKHPWTHPRPERRFFLEAVLGTAVPQMVTRWRVLLIVLPQVFGCRNLKLQEKEGFLSLTDGRLQPAGDRSAACGGRNRPPGLPVKTGLA